MTKVEEWVEGGGKDVIIYGRSGSRTGPRGHNGSGNG